MNLKTIFAVALVAASALATPMAFAADTVAPVPFDRPEIFAVQNVNFDGPYAGIGVIYSKTDETFAPVISAGYDARFDMFIVGAEVFATIDEDITPTLGVDVKAGVAVTDNLAVYGIAGVQTTFVENKDNVNEYSVGVGADYAINETVSLTTSYKRVFEFDSVSEPDDQFRVGFKVSF